MARVLLTHPYSWPHVHRGAEREVHGVASGLLARGHRVRLLSSRPGGAARRGVVDGVPVRWVRLPRVPRVSETAVFGAAVAVAAATAGVDVVHCFHYADAVGAVRARRRRLPVLLKLTGTVLEDRIGTERVEAALFRRAVAEADQVWVNSPYAADAMAWTGREMSVVPAGLDRTVFAPGPRAQVPTVLVTSAPTDPRKRLVDLLDAWPAVADAVPGVRLRVVGAAPVELLDRLPTERRGDVDLPGVLSGPALAREYAAAWALAAPAVHEALGLTVLEALSSGTPVAAARSGAHPGLLSAATGTLAEPVDPGSLAEAVVGALALARLPATATSCRDSTSSYGWDVVVPDIARRYREVLT